MKSTRLAAALCACLYASQGQAQSRPATDAPQDVTQLWSGFDPATLPFDVDLQKTWEENGARFKQLYFTSEVREGLPVRVFAYLGLPAGKGKVPGILHIHGGGQTASLEWIRFWTSRGYAVASFDWCGKWQDRTHYTRWGKVRGDMLTYGNTRDTAPSVRYAGWYHWAIAARRMLTLLEREPEVDGLRLGVFGISMGASLTWMVAATDPRIKTAVPMYGCGWNTYPDVHSGGGYRHPVPAEIDLWRATMEPETYARYITCPLLLLSGTNDFHANMDRCYDTRARVRAETRQAFTLRHSHHLEPAEARDLPLWMDSYLKQRRDWARSPGLKCKMSEGQLIAVVTPDRANEVASVRVAFAAGEERPQARFWRSVEVQRSGNAWQARLSVIDTTVPLRAIGNVTYAAGYTLTSTAVVVTPSSLNVMVATDTPSAVIDDFTHGTDDWTYSFACTDPYTDVIYLRACPIDDGRHAALGLNPAVFSGNPFTFQFGTHKVGDPKWRAFPQARISFKYRAAGDTTLEVHAWTDHWGPKQQEYVTILKPQSRKDWQEFTVSVDQCKSPSGASLPSWKSVDRLEFKGTGSAKAQPLFSQIEWR